MLIRFQNSKKIPSFFIQKSNMYILKFKKKNVNTL